MISIDSNYDGMSYACCNALRVNHVCQQLSMCNLIFLADIFQLKISDVCFDGGTGIASRQQKSYFSLVLTI